jgi:hypothetical protein
MLVGILGRLRTNPAPEIVTRPRQCHHLAEIAKEIDCPGVIGPDVTAQ